jgi:Ca2+/H+ antiporter, TMEM165/GDT1 family
MILDIIIPFIAIILAELGDKTQLSILVLSVKTDKHLQLFLGVVIAFIIVDGIAILTGAWITTFIPILYLKIASAIIFLVFGIWTLLSLRKKESEEKPNESRFKGAFLTGFAMIFVAEWGDKTQIASAVFATQYNPYLVFAGVVLALATISAAAIYLGKFISQKINKRTMTKVAGIVFLASGILFLVI